MKFKANSKFDSYAFGIISGFVVAIIITSIIIISRSGDFGLLDHYIHLFDSPILRSRVSASLKGGALALLPLFYLFLNKKMYKAVKGLMGVAIFIGLFIVYGVLK